MTTIEQTYDAVKVVQKFMARGQLSTIGDACRGEEAEFFKSKLVELAELFTTMPKTYEQDGKGDDAIAYLHYFHGGFDWYITERDMEDEQHQAFGLVKMHDTELGYISLVELAENGIELDMYFSPRPIGIIKEQLAL